MDGEGWLSCGHPACRTSTCLARRQWQPYLGRLVNSAHGRWYSDPAQSAALPTIKSQSTSCKGAFCPAMGSPLEGCVASLRNSMQLLDSSITILDEGVSDLPRLGKVLQTTRHFELISESDLQTAQSALLSEIRPEVDNLLKRVENYLDKLERREQSLMAKCDLNDGRLGRDSMGASSSRPSSRNAQRPAGAKSMSAQQQLRMKALRAKKDRLSYAVETLEMQAKQRERQLRMSMAAPQQLYDD